MRDFNRQESFHANFLINCCFHSLFQLLLKKLILRCVFIIIFIFGQQFIKILFIFYTVSEIIISSKKFQKLFFIHFEKINVIQTRKENYILSTCVNTLCCLFAAKFHTIPGKLVILSKKKVFLFNLFDQ